MKIQKFLVLFLFFTSQAFSQQAPNLLIDSLNFSENPEVRLTLSIEIAKQLADNDWERMKLYLDLAENEVPKTKRPAENLAKVYVTKAEIYSAKEAMDISLDYYLKAYAIYQKNSPEAEVRKIENNLAIIYAQANNPDQALVYFRRVLKSLNQERDSLQLVKVLNNMGTLYLDLAPDSSLYYYNKALPLLAGIDDQDAKTYLYTNLGRANGLKQNTVETDLYFYKADSLAALSANTSLKVFVYQSIAEYSMMVHSFHEAIRFCNKALELTAGSPAGFSEQRLNEILYHAYIEGGDYKQATDYFLQYDRIRDSLNIVDKAVNLERLMLEHEYNTEAKEQEWRENKKKYRLYLIGFSLVVAILVLTILLIKYRNVSIKNQLERALLKRKQEELKQHLDAKNKMLVGKAMNEIHRADTIHLILAELKKMKLGTVKKENQSAIDHILGQLEKYLNTNIWKEFEVSFEQVNQSFYDNLAKHHPDLSPKDRRLCALLSLDLSTKEISQITGQSFKAIENARTRLRRKLNLTHEKVNLSTYLTRFSLESDNNHNMRN